MRRRNDLPATFAIGDKVTVCQPEVQLWLAVIREQVYLAERLGRSYIGWTLRENKAAEAEADELHELNLWMHGEHVGSLPWISHAIFHTTGTLIDPAAVRQAIERQLSTRKTKAPKHRRHARIVRAALTRTAVASDTHAHGADA